MLVAFETEPTTVGLVPEPVYRNSVRRSGCAQGFYRHRSRPVRFGGGEGDRHGASRLERLEESV